MKIKAYVAAHNQQDARKVAQILSDVGYEITSSWINEELKPIDQYSDGERRAIAEKDVDEVLDSDFVFLLSSPYRVPGGKFVETGVAIGAGIPVVAIGHRENMLMWHELVELYPSIEDFIAQTKIER